MTAQRKAVVDRKIGRTVEVLVAARGVKATDVADAIGISRAGLYAKLAGSPFKAWEVAALADYFSVSVADMYDGIADRLGVELPRHASIVQPAGYKLSRPVRAIPSYRQAA